MFTNAVGAIIEEKPAAPAPAPVDALSALSQYSAPTEEPDVEAEMEKFMRELNGT